MTTSLSAIAPTFAQDLARAAFECAALATHLGENHPNAAGAERLFAVGYAAAIGSVQELRDQPGWDDLLTGPAGFILRQSDDFLVGTLWSSASRDIGDLIETEVPVQSGVGFETLMEIRALVANAEFRSRNCELIGIPAPLATNNAVNKLDAVAS